MDTCMTNIILVFAFIGGVTSSCIDAAKDNVVPVCTDCSKTGNVVQIDTSMVPISGNVICICHTTSSGKPTYFTIAYDGPDFKPCGIAFEFSAVNFSCAMDGLIRVKALGDIYFRKNYVGMATSATLSMYVEQTNATVTVICRNMAEKISTTATTDGKFSETSQSTLKPAESSSGHMATNTFEPSKTKTAILALASGVCGVSILLLTAVLLVVCYRRRHNNSKPGQSTDHVYVNTEHQNSDKVTEIGLFDENPGIQNYKVDTTYDAVDNDGEGQSVKVATPVLYYNVRTDDDKSTYNTLYMGKEYSTEHVYKSLEIEQSLNR